MSHPLVTIISPCYNHSDYVISSLDSIRRQTYPNIEHIIIDDFSSDNSVNKIEGWIRKHNYKCRFICHTENKGISYTLNESIRLMQGDYWSPLSTDDVIHPERTSEMVKAYSLDENIGMVVSDAAYFNDNGEIISHKGFDSVLKFNIHHRKDINVETNFGTYETLLGGNYFVSSLMLKKSVWDKVGLFNEELKMEDWDMWLRVSQACRIHFLDKKLMYYRLHDNNSVNQREVMISDFYKTFALQKKNCYGSPYEKIFIKQYKILFKKALNPYKVKVVNFLIEECEYPLVLDLRMKVFIHKGKHYFNRLKRSLSK